MSSTLNITSNYVVADGINIFYHSAGPQNGRVLLLLNGYPTGSYQYRTLINQLAHKYRLIAPDLPGFGFTEVPASRKYEYTFVNFGKTIEAFVDTLKLTEYALYLFDYGAPTGFYLALARPDDVTAIVSQNGNAYVEGLGPSWAPVQKYWADPTAANRDAVKPITEPAGIKSQYTTGVDLTKYTIDPLGYTLDSALVARPGNTDIQLDIFYDYRHNVDAYPSFQEYLRNKQPPLLAIWGKNDTFFIPPGAEAYKRDVPSAKVILLDTGHFALETHVVEVAKEIEAFLG